MEVNSDKDLSLKAQVILAIIITEGHADNIIFLSKSKCFAFVRHRDKLQVIVRKLGTVVTEANQ